MANWYDPRDTRDTHYVRELTPNEIIDLILWAPSPLVSFFPATRAEDLPIDWLYGRLMAMSTGRRMATKEQWKSSSIAAGQQWP